VPGMISAGWSVEIARRKYGMDQEISDPFWRPSSSYITSQNRGEIERKEDLWSLLQEDTKL